MFDEVARTRRGERRWTARAGALAVHAGAVGLLLFISLRAAGPAVEEGPSKGPIIRFLPGSRAKAPGPSSPSAPGPVHRRPPLRKPAPAAPVDLPPPSRAADEPAAAPEPLLPSAPNDARADQNGSGGGGGAGGSDTGDGEGCGVPGCAGGRGGGEVLLEVGSGITTPRALCDPPRPQMPREALLRGLSGRVIATLAGC